MVVEDKADNALGYVEWYPRWKCYAFMPENHVVLSHDCCLEMSRFLENCNKAESICNSAQPQEG